LLSLKPSIVSRLLGRPGPWQLDEELRTTHVTAFDADLATRFLYEFLRDRKAESAGAPSASGKERFEQAGAHGFGHTIALIFDAKRHRSFVCLGSHDDRARSWGSFKGVED
jgi:hypothetical protein